MAPVLLFDVPLLQYSCLISPCSPAVLKTGEQKDIRLLGTLGRLAFDTLISKEASDSSLPCPALPCPALPCPALPCPVGHPVD